MNLPSLIQQIYGVFTLTGLYSFEFVDKNRTTITEIFFMIPPKTKSNTEGTRSTTVPTLSGNYNNDAGNSTKMISLEGELFFPYVGSPDNPVAMDSAGLENTIDGMTEFFKLRWMLIRYRDYTMTKNSKVTNPITVMSSSNEIATLYKKVEKLVSSSYGALYDEIKLIIHDYDMDDHFYCRVETFVASQSSDKYIGVNYKIDVECYEPDSRQKKDTVKKIKQTSNAATNVINSQLQNIGYSEKFNLIQSEVAYNSDFSTASIKIETMIEEINVENTKIQSGQSTASLNIPLLSQKLLNASDDLLQSFLDIFLSDSDKILYSTGDITLDEVLDINLLSFYNSIQKIKISAESLSGVTNSIVQQDSIRYYASASDYVLTTDQFEAEGVNIVENNSNFYYYTVSDGDTARGIAVRELKDESKFINILQANRISESNFIDGTIIGEKIKIPIDITASTRSAENMIYESDPTDEEKFLHGTDIFTDKLDKLSISPKGDIAECIGIENTYNNVLKRIEKPKGSLNVFSPNWGIIPIDDGNSPYMVKVDRYITDVVSQIQDDPRVESVKMNFEKLEMSGEIIKTYSTVSFIGTEETREVIV